MESLKKRFFNLLALIKYVLESKTSIPFPEEENMRPYKKPYGYDFFQEDEDRKNFDELENDLKEEVIRDIKKYHYFRNKFEDISKALLSLSGTKGGQLTISTDMYKALMQVILKTDGIKSKNKKIKDIRLKPISLSPRGFLKKIKYSKKIGEIHTIEFEYEGSKLSISVFLYYVDEKMAIMSFIENSIEEIDGEKVFEKLEAEVNRVIRKLPITHIV